MLNFFKTYGFLFTLLLSVSSATASNHPGKDHLKDLQEDFSTQMETLLSPATKVRAKEVEGVFLKVKRVERLFLPKKKLSKKKYTIA